MTQYQSQNQTDLAVQIARQILRKGPSAPIIVQAMQDMRSERVVPRMDDWNTIYWEQFQDPLYHGKGTAADKMEALRSAGVTICESPAAIGLTIDWGAAAER